MRTMISLFLIHSSSYCHSYCIQIHHNWLATFRDLLSIIAYLSKMGSAKQAFVVIIICDPPNVYELGLAVLISISYCTRWKVKVLEYSLSNSYSELWTSFTSSLLYVEDQMCKLPVFIPNTMNKSFSKKPQEGSGRSLWLSKLLRDREKWEA